MKESKLFFVLLFLVISIGSSIYIRSITLINKKCIEEKLKIVAYGADPDMLDACLYIQSTFWQFIRTKDPKLVSELDRKTLAKCYFTSMRIMHSKPDGNQATLGYLISITTFIELKYENKKYLRKI